MPRQLQLSAIIELPDDVFMAAKVIAEVGEPWSNLLSMISPDIKCITKHEIVDARAPVERAKRGRKPNGAKPDKVGNYIDDSLG